MSKIVKVFLIGLVVVLLIPVIRYFLGAGFFFGDAVVKNAEQTEATQDLPVYPNSQLVYTWNAGEVHQEKSFEYKVASATTTQQIVDFYSNTLAAQAWGKVESKPDAPATEYKKGDWRIKIYPVGKCLYHKFSAVATREDSCYILVHSF